MFVCTCSNFSAFGRFPPYIYLFLATQIKTGVGHIARVGKRRGEYRVFGGKT